MMRDEVEGPGVGDGGSAYGRFQFGVAGNAAGHGSHLRVNHGATRIVVKAPLDALVVFPGPGSAQVQSIRTSGRQPSGLQWIPVHSLPMDGIAVEWSPLDSIGMDSIGFVAGEPAAVANVVTVGMGIPGACRNRCSAVAKVERGSGLAICARLFAAR